MIEAFALKTYFNTIVCVDPESGELIHSPLQDCPLNLSFEWKDQQLSPILLESSLNLSQDTRRKLQPNINVEFKRSGEFSLLVGGHYFSAEKGSPKVTCNRLSANDWERFSAINLAELQSRRLYLNEAKEVGFLLQRRLEQIPKIIHHIYLARVHNAPLPEAAQRHLSQFRTLNLNWQYRLWQGKDIHDAIYEWYGYDVLQTYLSINPRYAAARADLFRYLCIYKMGGAYFDIKAGLARPLDEVLNVGDQYILSQWNNGPEESYPNIGIHDELRHIPKGEFQQWHLIATPGHSFLEAVLKLIFENIRRYDRYTFGVGREGVLRTTGPIAYTRAIFPLLTSSQYRQIDAEAEGIRYNELGPQPQQFFRHYSELEEDIVL